MRARAARELAAHCCEAHTLPQRWRALGRPCGGPGAALGWRVVARDCLAGRGPGFVLGLRLGPRPMLIRTIRFPINFPNPEFISDTNNI